ncbi:MAG: UDP-N-acetylglucosamine 1-carboxyvinyltransferase, partial [Enterococcus viikkiensis]
MKKIEIHGGKPLSGNITISGAKNSAVALIPAAIMADSPVTLEGVPDIQDVHSLIEILEIMGAKVDFSNNRMVIDPSNVVSIPMPSGKITSLRASYYFMGSLVGKFGEAVVGLPGGCFLGPRPIDLHIKGFESLGANVSNEHGVIYLRTDDEGLKGDRIFMDVVSIGATINVMLAAVKAKGKTIIENAAKEPEIIDVATLLNNMGAQIRGAGTDEIRIEGVEELHGCVHSIIPDRIEAGTYLALAAAMGEGVTVHNVIYEHFESFIAKLEEIGVEMNISEDSIDVLPSKNLKTVDVTTSPYPGFATDLQQPLTPLLLKAQGTAEIIDTIYSKRVNHIPELVRMGADA